MALVLDQQVETTLPIEVDGVTPDSVTGLSELEIAKLEIWNGNRHLELGELFNVSGGTNDDQTIVFKGRLKSVHGIGFKMKTGTIQIESNAGRHVGSLMTGGEIIAQGSVSDFAGVEMMGGTIRIGGDAGDSVGGHLPGSKLGMNRGTILVSGSVGKGAGQGMRRGTIVVAGDAGELLGWNMLAGSILVFGECGAHAGAGMKRGTIVLNQYDESELLPTFERGGNHKVPVMAMMAKWLEAQKLSVDSQSLRQPLRVFHGDMLCGGRGELFVVS